MKWMKWALLFAMVLLLALPTACAEEEEMFVPFCQPDEVDVSQVRIEDGRLTGEILLPQRAAHVRVLVDCPLPQAFAPEQSMRLHVRYQKVTKKQLEAVIKAVGQNTKGGTLYQFISDPMTLYAAFERDDSLFYSFRDQLARDLTGHKHEREMQAALQLTRELMAQLDATPCEAFLTAQRNTLEDKAYTLSRTSSTYAAEQLDMQEEYYRQKGSYDDRTLVNALYELYGLPVMFQYYWADGQDMMGSSSVVNCAVLDDGTLIGMEVWGLPVVEEIEPVTLPERSWQELLKLWAANVYWPGSTMDEVTYDDLLYGPTTVFSSYEVLTDIRPCWVGREKQCLEPGWYFRTEKHVLSDDSLDCINMRYAAASDMQRVF